MSRLRVALASQGVESGGLAGELFQQALHAGGAELAAHRAGRVLERLDAVEDEQGALADDGVGEQAAFVPRRERRLALHAEPFEGVGKEGVFGGLPVFLGALAVEAPGVNTIEGRKSRVEGGTTALRIWHSTIDARPSTQQPLEPVLDEHGLAHAAPRDEGDDGGVRLGEGEVEEGEFLLAADEFFFALAGGAGEWEFVEVGFGFSPHPSPLPIGWGEGVKGCAAEFFGNLGGEFAEDAVLGGFGKLRERIGLIRRLCRAQPIVSLPVAVFANDGKDRQLVTLLAILEEWELFFKNIFGFEGFLGEQHHGKSCVAHGRLNVVIPKRTDADSAVLPHIEQAVSLEDVQCPQQRRLPRWPFAPVAVADEDAGLSRVHGAACFPVTAFLDFEGLAGFFFEGTEADWQGTS